MSDPVAEPPKKEEAPPPPAGGLPTARAPSETSGKKKGKGAASSASSTEPPPSASSDSTAVLLQPRVAEVQSISDVRPALQKWLAGQDALFGQLEKNSGLEREKIFYGLCGVLSLWLIVGPGGGFICNLMGVAYPAYSSVQTLRSPVKEDSIQWHVYWSMYGTLSMLDFFADRIGTYFPLYWLLKALFFLYLALPQTMGAHNFYVKYLDPLFDKIAKRAAAT